MFTFGHDLKKFSKKRKKWVLTPSETFSIYLKAVKKNNEGKNSSKKKKNKVNFDKNENSNKNDKINKDTQVKYKNKISGEKLYKVKGENQMLQKNNKKYINKAEDNEEDEDSNNSSSNSNDKNNTKNKNKKENSNKQLYYELLHNINELYDKESRKSDNDTNKNNIYSDSDYNNDNKDNDNKKKFKRKEKRVNTVDIRNINKGRNTLNNYYEEENIDNIDNINKGDFKRKEKRGLTIEGRLLVGNHDFTTMEDNYKGKGRVKYKKAKIRKFKSVRDDDNYESQTYNRRKKDNLYRRSSDKKNQTFQFEDSNKKLKHYKKDSNNHNLKNKHKNIISESNNNKDSDNEEENKNKNFKTSSGVKYRNKIRKIKNNSLNSKTIAVNSTKNKNTNNEKNSIKSQSVKKRKINIIISRNNKSNIPKLNNTQYKTKRKLVFTGPNNKKNKSLAKNLPKNISINKEPKDKQLNNKIKFKEMKGFDAIKTKFKKRLIEINDKLIDAIHYYNGPIDISCISSQNYVEAVNELNKKVLKNGFKCINNDNNYFKFSNGLDSFLVEIVKIRNNMLYYLVLKNQ